MGAHGLAHPAGLPFVMGRMWEKQSRDREAGRTVPDLEAVSALFNGAASPSNGFSFDCGRKMGGGGKTRRSWPVSEGALKPSS